MFYSHQILARKTPLGQIWMAATLHGKISRKKLAKLNIIKICEEILNPPTPMALRLSGILMGGVVIVYERKLKLLYEDATRLLVELNQAWKVKANSDPTLLPKGKSRARKEAITLPENQETDVGDMEQSVGFTEVAMGFQHTAYISMRLDNVDDTYVHDGLGVEDPLQNFHQADADNITLLERFDSYQDNTNMFNKFERFDILDDEETQVNYTSGGRTEMPTTLIPSPPHQDEPQRDQQAASSPPAAADEIIHDQHPEPQVNQQSDDSKEARKDQQRQGPIQKKRKGPAADEIIHDQHPEPQVNQQSDDSKEARQDLQKHGPIQKKRKRPVACIMDDEYTIIPGHIYQSWLQDTSDIFSRGGRNRKGSTNILSSKKVANLMELPTAVPTEDLFRKRNGEIHYPAPLLELVMKRNHSPNSSSSGRTSPHRHPEPSSSSPPERVQNQNPVEFAFEDLHSRVDSQSHDLAIEKLRESLANNDKSTKNLIEEIRSSLLSNGFRENEANLLVTPGNSADGVRSIPSSGSGHGIPISNISEVYLGRSNQKRTRSSSRQGSGGLEPVVEEHPSHYQDPDFRMFENGLGTDPELLVETAPTQTQTQPPFINPPTEKDKQLTDSIRMQMKMHFEAPGAPTIESLNNLTAGLTRSAATRLFYQTLVLVSDDYLRVTQTVAYGDILISRGPKM